MTDLAILGEKLGSNDHQKFKFLIGEYQAFAYPLTLYMCVASGSHLQRSATSNKEANETPLN